MGGTYADQWNLQAAQNGMTLPSAPQLVVLSGEWDMRAEVSDMMEFEISLPELVAEALGDLRASSDFHDQRQDSATVSMMEVDFGPRKSSYISIIPDTNVMISYLNVMDSLARFLTVSPDLSISILLPGIVMSELDGLRKAKKRPCQDQAQAANRWASSELGKGSVVRGQRDNATTTPGGSWRRHYYETGKENPDGYILDCVFYERSQASEGKWVVLTLDQNCAAQCFANSIPVITPSKLWSLDDLIHAAIFKTPIQLLPHHKAVLAQLMESAVSDVPSPSSAQSRTIGRAHISFQASNRGVVDWANAPDVTYRTTPQSHSNSSNKRRRDQRQVQSSSSMSGMEVDDDNSVPQALAPPLVRDPRDDLQEQLEAVLISVLPPLMEQSIAAHNLPTDLSIYAYPATQRGHPRPTKRPLPSLSSTEWKTWPLHECVLFLAEYPPPGSAVDDSKRIPTCSPPPPFSEKTQSALQYLASVIRKNRKGREFGRGDWERASSGLTALWPPFEEAIVQAVKDVFES